MALYSYRAMDPQGKMVRGRLDALNPLDLEMRLRRLNLDLVAEYGAGQRRSLFGATRVKRKDLITFCFHLEQLLRARVPMIEALVDLRDSINVPGFREVIANLIEAIEGGKRLSEALNDHPNVFDQVFVSLVHSGEETGELPFVLQTLTENLKWQEEISSQTRRLMLYPLFSGAVVFVMLAYLLIYLVPTIATVIKSMQSELSISTKVLLAVSEFCVNYWYLILAAPIVLFFALRAWWQNDAKLRERADRWLLDLPAFGPVLEKIILARFSTFFALMYANGISVLNCIRISERIVGNRVLEKGLRDAHRAIAEGQSLSAAFASLGLFPPLVLRMLRVGESTGALDKALQNVSYFYNLDVKESIGTAQQLIQPTMIVILAAIMLMVLVPMFGPIYDAISTVKF